MEPEQLDFSGDLLATDVPFIWIKHPAFELFTLLKNLHNRSDVTHEDAKRNVLNMQAFLRAYLDDNNAKEYDGKIKELVELRNKDLEKTEESSEVEEVHYQYWLRRLELWYKWMRKKGLLGTDLRIGR